MGDALVLLMLMAYLAALLGLAWVVLRAGSRYVTQRLGRVVDGSVKADLMSGMASVAWVVSFIVALLGSFVGCLLFIILGLAVLIVVFWLVMLMWT
jgi:hypothetical protein